MPLFRLAGVLALLGTAAFGAGLALINGLFDQDSDGARLSYIQTHKGKARASAALTALGLGLASAALPLWAIAENGLPPSASAWMGSLLLGLGFVFWLAYAFLRTEKPARYPYFAFTWQGAVSVLATDLGLGVFGLLFVMASTPSWLGYLFIVLSAAFLGGIIMRILPPIVFFVPILLAGFVFLLA